MLRNIHFQKEPAVYITAICFILYIFLIKLPRPNKKKSLYDKGYAISAERS